MDTAQALHQIFPQTLASGADAFLGRFLSQNLQAHFFPHFLREAKAGQNLEELAHYEGLLYHLKESPMPVLHAGEQLQMNPSFQWIARKDEIFALWLCPKKSAVQELKLNSSQAFLLETLNLERKFQFSQLVQWMSAHFPKENLSEAEWSKALQELVALEIVY